MGLLQNTSILAAEPLRMTGGVAAGYCTVRANYNRPDTAWNPMISFADTYDSGGKSMLQKCGIPTGYAPPYQFVIPIKDGGMASVNTMVGEGEISDTSYLGGAKTWPVSTITGRGTVSTTSTLTLLVQMFADIAGSGTISTGDMRGYCNLVIDLVGSGNADSALNVIAWMASNVVGSGDADTSDLRGKLNMAASIVVTGNVVTAKSCADAVWDTVLADHQDAGSTGKALNDAGSAGNPWSADADTNNDPGTMGEKIHKIKKDTEMIPAAI
jgi:hypothetical protein